MRKEKKVAAEGECGGRGKPRPSAEAECGGLDAAEGECGGRGGGSVPRPRGARQLRAGGRGKLGAEAERELRPSAEAVQGESRRRAEAELGSDLKRPRGASSRPYKAERERSTPRAEGSSMDENLPKSWSSQETATGGEGELGPAGDEIGGLGSSQEARSVASGARAFAGDENGTRLRSHQGRRKPGTRMGPIRVACMAEGEQLGGHCAGPVALGERMETLRGRRRLRSMMRFSYGFQQEMLVKLHTKPTMGLEKFQLSLPGPCNVESGAGSSRAGDRRLERAGSWTRDTLVWSGETLPGERMKASGGSWEEAWAWELEAGWPRVAAGCQGPKLTRNRTHEPVKRERQLSQLGKATKGPRDGAERGSWKHHGFTEPLFFLGMVSTWSEST